MLQSRWRNPRPGLCPWTPLGLPSPDRLFCPVFSLVTPGNLSGTVVEAVLNLDGITEVRLPVDYYRPNDRLDVCQSQSL